MGGKILALLLVLLAPWAARADSNALWNAVNGQCVPNKLARTGPAPCAVVDLIGEFALLKDRDGAAQFLLIPTVRITGIESPLLQAPAARNYWADAWAERKFVMARAPRPLTEDEVGLAVNPPSLRSQDQLHIHMDCVRPEVMAQLRGLNLTGDWLRIRLLGVVYQARRFDMTQNPFQLMAAEAARQNTVMANWSLASIGPHTLLVTRYGATETLLDHSCLTAG